MASPDVSPYVDLTVYDKSVQDVYDDGALDLQTKLPEWVPREGNTEVLLMSTLALQIAETIFSINRLPAGITEVLIKLFGITRDVGLQPVANLTFTVANDQGYTIPAGVRARLNLAGGLDPVIFTTNTELVIASGNTTGSVLATGDRYTDEANGTTSGTLLDYLESTFAVDSVEVTSISTDGRNPESDTDYFTRGTTRFTRLSDTLVLPKDFVAYALEDVTFQRALGIDNWDANIANTPGTIGGHVTVAVYGLNRLNTSNEKTALATEMGDLALANLVVHVIDPDITSVDVTTTVVALAGYDAATVTANITAALTDYLSPMTWEWGQTVRKNELIALVSNVAGVDYVDTMTVPASDVTLTGYAPLAQVGTLSITVN